MAQMACNHCGQPRCHLCLKWRTDARYRQLWGEAPTGSPLAQQGGVSLARGLLAPSTATLATVPARRRGIDRSKPKVTVEELATKRRH